MGDGRLRLDPSPAISSFGTGPAISLPGIGRIVVVMELSESDGNPLTCACRAVRRGHFRRTAAWIGCSRVRRACAATTNCPLRPRVDVTCPECPDSCSPSTDRERIMLLRTRSCRLRGGGSIGGAVAPRLARVSGRDRHLAPTLATVERVAKSPRRWRRAERPNSTVGRSRGDEHADNIAAASTISIKRDRPRDLQGTPAGP